MPDPAHRIESMAWRADRLAPGERIVPEETAVAFTYDGTSYAVMMATPCDLEDFAVGFSLTEGIVDAPAEIEAIDIVEHDTGIELRMRLAAPHGSAFAQRRRYLAGPTGCGLCGIETLDEAMRAPAAVASDRQFTPQEIMRAVGALDIRQELYRATHAVHAAAFCRPADDLVVLREDVGRHNALDKLAGALARIGEDGSRGFAVVTSRLSVEMIQKAAAIGVPLLVAVSAPTALAVRMAQDAGMTLVAVARNDGFEIFTHSHRIKQDRSLYVVAG